MCVSFIPVSLSHVCRCTLVEVCVSIRMHRASLVLCIVYRVWLRRLVTRPFQVLSYEYTGSSMLDNFSQEHCS